MSGVAIAATIHDPMGPRWSRLVAPFFAAVLVVFGFSPVTVVLVPLLVLANQRWFPRYRPRACTLHVEPGRVHVRGAGVLNQTLRTRKVSAFSVAKAAKGGAAIALRRNDRAGMSTLFDVASAADAERVRTALGIGSGGVGYLAFTLRPSQVSVLEHIGGLLLLLFGIAGLGLALLFGSWPVMLLALAIVPLLHPRPSGPQILFDRDHVRVPGRNSIRDIRYAEIAAVAAAPGALSITRRAGEQVSVPVDVTGRSLHGMDAVELEHVAAQLDAAAQRAQKGALPDDDSVERLAILRQNGDGARQWLARLDATAEMMVAGRGGYRGPTFDERELFRVMESPDADAELRGAAARVLVRAAPGARRRIDAVLASIRDVTAEKRVRILLEPDVEKASVELDDHDVREMVRGAGR